MPNFYKYADNPTIYGDNNQAFSSAEDFFKAGGAKDFSNVQTIKGQATPTLLAQPTQQNSNPSINLSQLNPQTPVVVPTPNYKEATVPQFVADVLKPTETDTKYQAILDSIATLTQNDTGKEQYRADQENAFGAKTLSKDIADLNSQIQLGNAELNKMEVDFQKGINALESSPQQIASVVGSKQQQLQRTYALERASKVAEVGFLQARQAGLNGQLNTAIALADRAVKAKYAPIEEELQVKKAQLEAIKPLLDKQEKQQAEILKRKYDIEKEQIDTNKKTQTQNIKMALDAGITTPYYNYAGEIRNTTNGEAYKDAQSFFQASGITSWQDPRLQSLVTDYKPQLKASNTEVVTIGGKKVLINSTTGEVIETLGRSGSGEGDGNKTYNIKTATQEIKDTWTNSGYIQGNGKISSTDYKKGKAWWTQQGLKAVDFDNQFSNLIDQSSKTWKSDYGYKGN